VTFIGFIPRRGIAVRFDRQIHGGYLSGVGGGMQRRIGRIVCLACETIISAASPAAAEVLMVGICPAPGLGTAKPLR